MKRSIGAMGIILGGLTAGCDLVETVLALVTGGDEVPSAAAEAGPDQTGQEQEANEPPRIDSNVAEPKAKPAEPATVTAEGPVSTADKKKQATAAVQAGKQTEHEKAEPVVKLDAKRPASEPLDKAEPPKEDSKAAPSAGTQRPRIRTGATTASGEVDATSAHRALRGARASLMACYERALKENPESHGTITVALQIGAEGQVTGAKSSGAPGLPSQVTQCALGIVRGLKFPLKDGSKSGTLSVPVTFTPG